MSVREAAPGPFSSLITGAPWTSLIPVLTVNGHSVTCLPPPPYLVDPAPIPGLDPVRRERLGAIAQAALDGELGATGLHRMVPLDARAHLEQLRGIGPFDSIEVEPDSGEWVVVDDVPEYDLSAPGLLAISWRGESDEVGALSLPADELIAARTPLEAS